MERQCLVCLIAVVALALTGCGEISSAARLGVIPMQQASLTPGRSAMWLARATGTGTSISETSSTGVPSKNAPWPGVTRTPELLTATPFSWTPVPIADWLEEGIPPDTFIRYQVAKVVDFSVLVDISADGTVRSAVEDSTTLGGMIEGQGQITRDELRALLLKFAEVDFFGLEVAQGTCVYHSSRPPDPSLHPSASTDLSPVALCLTLHGTGKAILYDPGFRVPCDPAVLSTEASPQGRGGALAELEDMIQEIGRRVARAAKAATPTPALTPIAAATPLHGVPAPPAQAEALALMFGDAVACRAPVEGPEPVCQRRWPGALTDPRFDGVFATDILTVRVIGGFPYRQQALDRYLVFTSNNEETNTCHGCAPVLDGAVLSWVDGRWTLTSLTQDLLQAGTWSEPPYLVEALRLGPEKQGALLHVGSYGMGTGAETVYVVAPVGGHLQTVFEGDVSGDNHSDCCALNGYPCYSYDSTLHLRPGENPDYYDLVLTVRGTVLNFSPGLENPFIERVDEIAVYRFLDGVYRKRGL
jgi:hypothetical protein